MTLVGITEEMKKMKVRLIALACGILLAVGLPIAASAGPADGGGDADGDMVLDAFDNCTNQPNPLQEDIDHDGCGDACDNGPISADETGDGIVGGPDFLALSQQFGSLTGGSADFTNDGIVGGPDFLLLSQQFGNILGPSGITNAMRDFDECPL